MEPLREALKVGKDDLVLYFGEGSFYSDKARIAMVEKKLKYKNAYLDLDKKEHLAPWYMKINPKGTVPTLQHGDKFIPDSDAIIQYLEDNFGEPLLQPDRETDLGQQVEKLSKQLSSLNISVITYGSLRQNLNPYSKPMQAMFLRRRARLQDTVEEARRLAERHPDLKESYLEKARVLRERVCEFYDQSLYEAEVAKAREVVEEVNNQLKRAAEKEVKYLYGDEFTLADVNLSIVLHRLWATGLSNILFEPSLPLVEAYYYGCHKRQSYRQVCYAFLHHEAARYSASRPR